VKKSTIRFIVIFSAGLFIVAVLLMTLNTIDSSKKEPEWLSVSLPTLPGSEIELSVAYVSNPRFPDINEQQLKDLLDKTVELSKQHFGVSLVFTRPVTLPMDQFFDYLNEEVKSARSKEIVDIKSVGENERTWMQQALMQTLNNYRNDQQAVIDYARPYLLEPLNNDDFTQLSKALVNTLLTRLQYWREQKAGDGQPVINNTPYNEWVWWDSIGYGNMPYDVVITNQLVASAEFYDMAVHSSIRGGITAGTTSYSQKGRFNAYTYITVYPMLNDSSMLVELRQDSHYSEAQIVGYAAALLTHELGHLLLHLGHPFGNKACIMSPTPLLKYREWVQELDVSKCPLNSEEAMAPGKATIEYRSDW